MQCHQSGQVGVRQVVCEIDGVTVHHVYAETRQCARDRPSVPLEGHHPRVIGNFSGHGPARHQCTGNLGAEIGDNNRAVAGTDQRVVERREDLLGAANRIRPDRCQCVADAEHSQRQAHQSRPNASSACFARRRHSALLIPQPNVSYSKAPE